MEQDFEALDKERRLKTTKRLFVLLLILSLVNVVLAYMVVDRKYVEAGALFSFLYIIGNAFLVPFCLTNAVQIFPKYRNSGSRVRWFFASTVIMFLLLLNMVSQLGLKFGNIF